MEKEDTNYSGSFLGVDFTSTLGHQEHADNDDDHHRQQQQQFMMSSQTGENSCDNGNLKVDYLLNNPTQHLPSGEFCSPTSFDKLSFADVMQFADLGPKLALNQNKTCQEEEENGRDPIYFLKFPVLNEGLLEDQSLLAPHDENDGKMVTKGGKEISTFVQSQILEEGSQKGLVSEGKNKRKRPRTIKTTEEVESQRMTHIAVERNRRKQMNEHLRVLRALMPGSYVQRGDQASIIGGAIEFVRELEQLLQCLESQKRRRIYGDTPPPLMADSSSLPVQQPPVFPLLPLPPDDQIRLVEYEPGLREETAESKSCVADVEVRVLGFDAMIKILCRRMPGQLINTIAALEDLQLTILHTNITTIEQTVLYSFNVKVASEARFTAEDIANSVQEILAYIHANTRLG